MTSGLKVDMEEAPSLVDARDIALEDPSATNMETQMQDLGLVRVPISIITGEYKETP